MVAALDAYARAVELLDAWIVRSGRTIPHRAVGPVLGVLASALVTRGELAPSDVEVIAMEQIERSGERMTDEQRVAREIERVENGIEDARRKLHARGRRDEQIVVVVEGSRFLVAPIEVLRAEGPPGIAAMLGDPAFPAEELGAMRAIVVLEDGPRFTTLRAGGLN